MQLKADGLTYAWEGKDVFCACSLRVSSKCSAVLSCPVLSLCHPTSPPAQFPREAQRELPCQGCTRIKHAGVTSDRSLAPKCKHFCVILSAQILNCFFLAEDRNALSVHVRSVLEEKWGYFGMTLLKYLFFTNQKKLKALSQNELCHLSLQEHHIQCSAHLLVFSISSLTLLYIHDYLLFSLLRKKNQCSPWLLVWNIIPPLVLIQHLPSGAPLTG